MTNLNAVGIANSIRQQGCLRMEAVNNSISFSKIHVGYSLSQLREILQNVKIMDRKIPER